MSRYLTNIGNELCFVLQQACKAQPEQFAGYCANLDFWVAEYRHLKSIIEGYETRLCRMQDARDAYLAAGNTRPQNFDDYGNAYQHPRQTSKQTDRNQILESAREHMLQFCDRGLQLGTISTDDYDTITRELTAQHIPHKSI